MWDKSTGWDIKARVVHQGWKLDQERMANWHHFLGTWDGKTIKLYIDGKKVEKKEYAGPIQTTTAPIYISREGTEYAFGIIDEMAIFKTAFAVEDIETLMDNGLEYLAAVSHAGRLTSTWDAIKTP